MSSVGKLSLACSQLDLVDITDALHKGANPNSLDCHENPMCDHLFMFAEEKTDEKIAACLKVMCEAGLGLRLTPSRSLLRTVQHRYPCCAQVVIMSYPKTVIDAEMDYLDRLRMGVDRTWWDAQFSQAQAALLHTQAPAAVPGKHKPRL